MKKKVKWSTFILLLIFFIGLSVLLYPAISTYWNSLTQSQAVVDYDKMLKSIPKEDYDKYFAEAEAYNNELAKLQYPYLDYGKLKDYDSIFDVTDTGMMGYVTIDKIGVELPIYHGTGENVLSIGAGHVKGSSFPSDKPATHTVLSAHRGLPTATLFTHLDHVEIGDTFEVTVLDRTITYQVDQIKTVDPDDMSDVLIDDNENYCTLVTCTPYGINTHRLLVRGKQIDASQQKKLYITSDAHRIDTLIVTPIVALPILLVSMIVVLMKPVKKDDLGDDI